MSQRTDILLDSDLQLREDPATLDLVEGESTAQHLQLLILLPKGSLKETPAAGVGIVNYLEAEDMAGLLAEIGRELRADGMRVDKLAIENGKPVIEARYE